MDSYDLLVEIGTEELPPKALKKLSEAFVEGVQVGITKAQLSFGEVKPFATPRRLAILIHDLQAEQPDSMIERKGPALTAAFDTQGNPTPACAGFAKSCGVEVSQLEQRETDKGTWLYSKQKQHGKSVKDVLPEIVSKSLKQLPVPRPMRWGNDDIEFIRPVHWVVMLFGKEIIPCELLGKKAGRTTVGHRFHHPDTLTIDEPKNYKALLSAQGYVEADFEERKNSIKGSIIEIAHTVKGEATVDETLLDEVTGLVEWPVALVGAFDKAFLDLPPEALITTMQHHQKCFAVKDGEGNLMPYFITVSNIESLDPHQVLTGNERVMRARLSDAAFFYKKDKQQRLEERVETLSGVIFQTKLGTLYDKTLRLEKLATVIAEKIKGDTKSVQRAAHLCKADLMTEMVGEFPELQGVMGYYYGVEEGESYDVALALKEYYYPRFAKDVLPSNTIGSCLALAERFDTLVGIFGINQAPTGEKDPFALRRAAQGIVKIIIENQFDIDILEMIERAANVYEVTLPNQNVVGEVQQYIIERLRTWYQDKGVTPDIFNAVLARQGSNLLDFNQRLLAVTQFRQLSESQALAAANKRVSRLLLKEGKGIQSSAFDNKLLELEAERTLAISLGEKQKQVEPLYKKANYSEALSELASLQEPVDHFFDDVMVMVDDEKVRNNRLALLAQLRELFLQIADISLLQ